VERNGDSGGGYESHLQGFVGGDMRGNIVRCTGYRCNVTEIEVGSRQFEWMKPFSRGLSCMCASSVVELPFPKIANKFSYHSLKGTFAIFWGPYREVMSGRGSVCRSILKAWVTYRMR